MIGFFEENMWNAEPRRARSGTQTAWAGAYYRDAKIRDQLSLPKNESARDPNLLYSRRKICRSL